MFRYIRALLVLGITVIGLLVASSAALAGRVHVFGSTFAEEGSGAGQLKEPSGVAVNEATLANAGDVYVTDTGNNRVEHFSPEGKELKGEFDGGATPVKSFSEPSAIAVDNSTNALDSSAGDVYVADFGHSVVDKFSPEGSYLGQITTGKEGAPLGEIYGVAVDPQGVVWIYQASGEIDDYSNAAANVFISSREDPFEEKSPGFAVDSGDNLYVNRGALQIAKLDSGGAKIPGFEALNPEENATAAAVNTSDDVSIDEGASIAAFDPQAALIERFGTGHLAGSHGVAVDSASDLVYAANRENGTVTVFTTVLTPTVLTGDASNLATEGSATLKATVNPEGVKVSSCFFEYGRTTSYGSTAECTPAPGSGSSPVAVSADVSGLEVGRYHYRIVASNANGESVGADSAFISGGNPVIFGQSLADVGASTVRVSALLNAGGLLTSYRLEYGRTTSYGETTPAQSAGAPLGTTGIEVTVTGLTPGSEYHARLLASNALGSTMSPDIAFTTAAPAGGSSSSSCPNRTNAGFSSQLPDCRAYEDVSLGGGPGEVYVPRVPNDVAVAEDDIPTPYPMRAAAEGSGVAYVGEAGLENGSGHGGRGLGDEFIAVRNGSHRRWDATDVTPIIAAPEELGSAYEPTYEALSSDLSVGILGSNSQSFATQAAPPGPGHCNVLYSRTTDGRFHALFTGTLTPGTCGSIPYIGEGTFAQNLLLAGANTGSPGVAANSHVLFQSPAPLTEPAAPSASGNGNNLYESVGGAARLVSLLPGGQPDGNAVFGGLTPQLEGPLASSQVSRPDFDHVISADGARIFWTDLTTGQIYMRLNGTSTVPISEGSARYLSATPDGRYVFYAEGEKLIRYDTNAPAGAEREELAGAGTGVQGVAGVSEDGSYVYFVASGALASGAEARRCREAHDEKIEKREKSEPMTGEEEILLDEEQHEEDVGRLSPGRGCNLYVWHAGTTRLVAALGAADDQLRRPTGNNEVLLGAWQGELGSRTAQVADAGRTLVFESARQLTGYDNSRLDEEAGSERGVEVFVYDAGAGKITCASCDPVGAAPVKETKRTGGGTYVPISANPTMMPRWVSNDGSRVFFATSQPLVSQDRNGVQDVYEWEREGTAGCPAANSKWGGCIFLLSGGASGDLSFLIDASADGSDVFFTHRGQLAGVGQPADKTELFDARALGGFPESAAACEGTGCQGVPPAPPSFASPSSSTFSGPGNFPPPQSVRGKVVARKTPGQIRAEKLAKALKVCKKQKLKPKRLVCERRARGLYGSVRAKGRKAARKQALKGKTTVSGRSSDRGSR